MQTGFGIQNPHNFPFPGFHTLKNPIQAQRCSRRASRVLLYPFPLFHMDLPGFQLQIAAAGPELGSSWEVLPKALDSPWICWIPLPPIPSPAIPISSGCFSLPSCFPALPSAPVPCWCTGKMLECQGCSPEIPSLEIYGVGKWNPM